MKIMSLEIETKDSKYMYNFTDKVMIYSKENSMGKTTLLRFILYALGYQIPATEGIKTFDRFVFNLKIDCDGNFIKIVRKDNFCELIGEGYSNKFQLPEQEHELHSIIFKIENLLVLNNLLAVFYIDQEKGWTLLNRGKIIGNIRFNIENFIAGISNIDITDLLSEKTVVTEELKKYRYLKNVLEINEDYSDDLEDNISYRFESMDDLLQEQRELELKLRKIKHKRKKIQEIIKTNKGFAELIENYGLKVRYKNNEFFLTTEMLSGYQPNQDFLKLEESMYKVEEEKLMRNLKNVLNIINKKNALFSMDDILESMEKTIESLDINSNQIEKIIRQLNNKRTAINEEIKEKLSFNNELLYKFYLTIISYAEELGIKEYIAMDSPKFVLTNKLKGLSGRVMTQLSFIFKLSYIKAVNSKYNVYLPIIIDSPRTNELSENSTDDMMAILKRDFGEYQIIFASIYENNVMNLQIIDMNNGLFSDSFKVK